MAGQKGVEDYLEKHRISALFEDLMSRLVKSLPNDPVPYLIKVLQKVEKQQGMKPRLPAAKQKPPSTPTEAKRSRHTIVRTISSGTSEWVVSPTNLMGADRGYERPWVQNMKKIARSPDSSVEDAPRARKPKRAESKTPLSPPGEKEKSIAKLTANSELWAVAGEESASRMPAPSDQPRPTSQQQEEALMMEELSTKSLGRKVSREEKKEEPDAPAEQRRASPGQKSKEHKKELASLVASQRAVDTLTFLDTGEEDPVGAPIEEATDVLEDADELMDEGLGNVKSSGQKVKKKPKSSGPEVKVTMCSTCARVVKGDGSSEVKRSHPAFSSSSVTSSFVTSTQRGMSDDDFESASQVTGPRQPVWESEGEDSGRSVHDGTSEIFQMGSGGQMRQQAWTESSQGRRQVAGQPESLAWQTLRSDDDDSTI